MIFISELKTWFIASDVLNILSKSFNCSNKKYFKIHFKLLTPSAMLLSTAAAAKLLQLGPTMCDPIDSSPPGYPVPGILQARTLEWVAISFSNKTLLKKNIMQTCCNLDLWSHL